jgi:hypothetical protein
MHNTYVLYIISPIYYSLQMLIYGYGVETPCTISLDNFDTTYHFLGRRQNARYVNYSNLTVQMPPFFLTVPNWLTIHTPSSTQHTQQLNLNTLILLANLLIDTLCLS